MSSILLNSSLLSFQSSFMEGVAFAWSLTSSISWPKHIVSLGESLVRSEMALTVSPCVGGHVVVVPGSGAGEGPREA